MAQSTRKKNAKLKIPEIQAVKIADLKPHPNNPRIHPDSAIAALVNSIKSFGWTIPIIITEDNIILAGHARLKAALEAGYSEVPAIAVPLKGAKADAYMVADNKLAELTGWDLPVLKDLLRDLDAAEIDLELLGFGQEEIEDLLGLSAVEIVEDEAPLVPEKAICKLGDLWLLGNHQLLCGDATERSAVEKLMDGDKADMVFTDPPYGVDYTGKTAKALKIQSDDQANMREWLTKGFGLMAQAMKEGAPYYVCAPSGPFQEDFQAALNECGLNVRQTLIWVKDTMVLGHSDYHYKHEPILYGWAEGKHYFTKDRTRTSVFEIDRPKRSQEHPTMKPIELIAELIINSSQREMLVFDPFIGSGSTLIAADQTGRVCYGMEIDPLYCDVIIQRWQNFTGQVALSEKGETWGG